jgi:phosphohistidine phosphatase
MQLLFLRHGPAEPKSAWTGEDEARPLTPEGKLLVTDIACSLPRLKTRPDRIITSPLARARQTAEIVGACLGAPDKVVVDKRLAPGFGLKQLEKLLRDHADDEVLMLVAHDPDLSELVRDLTGGGRVSIRKGGLAQVEIPDAKVMKGRLLALLIPAPTDLEATPDSDGGDQPAVTDRAAEGDPAAAQDTAA